MKKRSSLQIVRAVIFALVLREVRARFGADRLGAFWFVFEPMAHLIVVVTIFSMMRGSAVLGIEYPFFIITGLIPFLLMKNIVIKGMLAIDANKALFAYRQIKPVDTIVARTIVECALMSFIYVAFVFAFGYWAHYDVNHYYPLQWLEALLIGIGLSIGLALIFCVVINELPEAKTFITLLFMPLYLISGVIVPLWLIPRQLHDYILWNPFLHIVDRLRGGVFEVYPVSEDIDLAYAAKVALASILIGIFLYRAKRLKLVAR